MTSVRWEALDPGVGAHCRRVAALAVEVAVRLRLSEALQYWVEQTALWHHYPVTLFELDTLDRLMKDLGSNGYWSRNKSNPALPDLPDEVKRCLRAMQAPARQDQPSTVAQVVEVANLFVEKMELLPLEYRTVEQMIDELRALSEDDLFRADVIMAAASLPRARRDDLLEIVYRLPVFPTVALRALDPASDDHIGAAQLYELATSDKSLASSLVQVANSSLYSPPKAIASIRQAIAYIGLKASRKVLTASVLRPLFGTAKTGEIWKHSLIMAQFCERLAVICGLVDPKEAFLAGLVHDVGRLAMEKMTGDAAAARERMLRQGCEPMFIEKILCRFDHADLGADILQRWNFPEAIVEAVRSHHQPEQRHSPFAALLYLGEYWTGAEEDLPSAARLALALERTRITVDQMESADGRNGLLDSLIRSV
ncbi:MAG: HDOD domain-containing protein [Acidobacteria bacterium]|nr:HDOD domain-containing protein [Acidobacteriota bacterium]